MLFLWGENQTRIMFQLVSAETSSSFLSVTLRKLLWLWSKRRRRRKEGVIKSEEEEKKEEWWRVKKKKKRMSDKEKRRRKEGVTKREEEGGRKRENHRQSFLSLRLSVTEQTVWVFLLEASSPLRVTGRPANQHQHKTPSRPRGRRWRRGRRGEERETPCPCQGPNYLQREAGGALIFLFPESMCCDSSPFPFLMPVYFWVQVSNCPQASSDLFLPVTVPFKHHPHINIHKVLMLTGHKLGRNLITNLLISVKLVHIYICLFCILCYFRLCRRTGSTRPF